MSALEHIYRYLYYSKDLEFIKKTLRVKQMKYETNPCSAISTTHVKYEEKLFFGDKN